VKKEVEIKFSLKMSDHPHPYHLIWVKMEVEIKVISVNLDFLLIQVSGFIDEMSNFMAKPLVFSFCKCVTHLQEIGMWKRYNIILA